MERRKANGGNSKDKPLRNHIVNICAIRMNVQEVTPSLFNTNETSAVFPHCVSELFAAHSFHEPSQFRMHVIIHKEGP